MMELTLWRARIFRARDHFYPSSGETKAKESHQADCVINVYLGTIPDRIVAAQSYANTAIYRLLGLEGPAPSALPTAWDNDKELFTTILISTVLDMDKIAGEWLPLLDEPCWYATHPAELALNEYITRTQPLFEGVAGSLIVSLGHEIIHASARDSSVFIESSTRPAMPIVTSTVGPAHSISDRKLSELGPDPIGTALVPKQTGGDIRRAAGRWATIALQEEDPIKQFLWCFAGLDSLSSKALKYVREDLLDRTVFRTEGSSDLQGIAVREILWPTAHTDEQFRFKEPDRNLTFKFAALALTLSPNTANADVENFKKLKKFRDRIHGGDLLDYSTAVNLAPDAVRILMRYVKLIGSHL